MPRPSDDRKPVTIYPMIETWQRLQAEAERVKVSLNKLILQLLGEERDD